MLNETFYLDGVDALSVGIHLQNPVEFSEAKPVVKIQSIPGRNGDLVFDTGAFENRSGIAECFAILSGNVETAITAINKFLLSKRGYRRLEVSDDPDHYWLARVENGARIEQRLRTLAPFEIRFDCKPQRFVKGDLPFRLNANGNLYNSYGFETQPLIAAYGNGEAVLNVSGRTVEISELDGVLYIDSETQNAYNNDGNKNNMINAPLFPVLKSGENLINWTGGIQYVEITPRWWVL